MADAVIRTIVSLSDSDDPDEVDDAALSLRRALADVPGIEVRDGAGAAPSLAGAKGALAEIGTLAVTVLGARPVFRVLVDALRVWTSRAADRRVTLRLGEDSVDLAGLPPEEVAALVRAFVEAHAADRDGSAAQPGDEA